MIDLNPEQQKAYDRFIRARDKVGIVKRRGKWIPLKDILACVDVTGLNHPMYIENDDWLEYKDAFAQWLAVEPEFRERERMRMSRGDYGTQDSWEDRNSGVTDSYSKIKEDK
jgi:hypothetical protein